MSGQAAAKQIAVDTANLDVVMGAGDTDLQTALESIDESGRRGDGVLNTVTTTDGVATTIATIPIPDDTVVHLQCKVVARRTDSTDRGVYRREAAIFREAAGAATKVGNTNSLFTRESDNQWDVTIVVSGNNALVQVEGRTGRTINWKCQHHVLGVA